MSFAMVVGVLAAMAAPAVFAQADAAATAEACAKGKITKKIEKPISAAEKAFNDKQWDEALAKIAEAEAVQVERTEFDRYWVHEYRGRAYVQKQQYAEATKDLEASLNSPCLPEADKPARYKILAQLGNQNREFPKIVDYGNKYLATNEDLDIKVMVGNAYYAIGDHENARKTMAEVIPKLEARLAQDPTAKPPQELTFRVLHDSCVKLKDNACIVEQLERLVKYHPQQQYWQNLIAQLMAQSKSNTTLLNMWRLAENVDAMTDPAEYTEMAQLAIQQGLPGEAQQVIEKGMQKGAFADAKAKERANLVLTEAKQAAAMDKATLDKQDAAAKAKPTGDNDVKLGAAYLSYGDQAKAIEALQRGLGKGGVKNTDEANILLGIAQLRAGNKPEAAKAFQAVSQDPVMTRIAKLWQLRT